MNDSSQTSPVDLSAGAQSDWWSSGDPRLNRDARTNVAATPTVSVPQSATSGYSAHWSGAAVTPLQVRSDAQPAVIALLISGILMIIGSVTAWATISVFGHSISANGTDSSISMAYSVNGWLTVGLAIVLVVMAALMMASEERTFAAVAGAVSVIATGFATYFLVRILHDISKAHSAAAVPAALRTSEHVGWGLIVLLIGAVAAMVASISALRSR